MINLTNYRDQIKELSSPGAVVGSAPPGLPSASTPRPPATPTSFDEGHSMNGREMETSEKTRFLKMVPRQLADTKHSSNESLPVFTHN